MSPHEQHPTNERPRQSRGPDRRQEVGVSETGWAYSQTSKYSDSLTVYMSAFYHVCTVQRVHARGSNALVRREFGRCTVCGKAHRRVIRWDTKDARSWWEPIAARPARGEQP